MFIEEKDRTRVREHSRNIGGNKAFAVNTAYDDRSALANRDNFLRIVGGNHREGEKAFELFEYLEDSLLEIPLKVFFDQVGDDFGIRLCGELVTFFDELPL